MELALLEDRLEEGARLPLAAAPRVVYVVSGHLEIDGVAIADNQAWHAVGACVIQARAPSRVWRWELRADGAANDPALKLSRALTRPEGGALMRCDRVDFPPRGVAYTHTHQGPGI